MSNEKHSTPPGSTTNPGQTNEGKYDLLAPELPDFPRHPFCAGCGRLPASVGEHPAKLREFREIVGLTWRTPFRIKVKMDRQSLGLSTSNVEDETLCLPCAITHMRRFNFLMTQRKREMVS